MQIKNKIKEYFIGRGNIADHKPGKVSDMKNPKSICLFFTIDQQQQLDQIIELIKSNNLTSTALTVYVFNRSKNLTEVITHQSIFCFDLNDFDLFGNKNEILAQRYSTDKFEILISFTGLHDKVCRKLVSEINASFKIGPENPYHQIVYDLIIADKMQDSSFKNYFDQVMHYLSVLNITTR